MCVVVVEARVNECRGVGSLAAACVWGNNRVAPWRWLLEALLNCRKWQNSARRQARRLATSRLKQPHSVCERAVLHVVC